MATHRVSHEPAYVLHRYDWSESSLILETFTRHHGRIALVAKGAKRPSSNFRPVLLPLQRSVAQARRQVAGKQADLQWMRSMGPALAAAGPGPATAPTGQSLVVLIDTSARESGLGQALTSSQPAGGAVRIQLESADFNLLVGWLSRLASQHGVRVESASVTGSAAPGIVNASVVLRAP